MGASDLVNQWRKKAAQKAAERAAQVISVPVCFAGFTGKAHRLDLMSYARAQKLPQFLTSAMFAAVEGKTTEVKKSQATPEQVVEMLRFQRIAFCDMMDEPKFSTEEMRAGRELADDEIDYTEFVMMCPEAVREGAQWQLDGCPTMSIPTESGEVSLEDLTNFRDSGEGVATSESGEGSKSVWWKTTPITRNLGNIG